MAAERIGNSLLRGLREMNIPPEAHVTEPDLDQNKERCRCFRREGCKKIRRRCCMCCSCCCLIPMVLLLRLFGAAVHNCGLRLSGIRSASAGGGELMWFSAHWLSLRTVTAFQFLIPGYGNVHWYAHAHPEGETRRCSVTIHDAVGRNSTMLDRLLDLLNEFSVNATFFVIADQTLSDDANRTAMLRRIVGGGHELGNHGVEGTHMWQQSEPEFRAAVQQWESRIRQITPWPANSRDRKWFSPPKGLMSSTMASVLEDMGYEAVIGDVYTNDLFFGDIDYHARVVSGSTCDGSVLLFHMPDSVRTFKNMGILKKAFIRLRERDFRFLRLTDMFAKEGGGFWGACGVSVFARIFVFLACCTPLVMCFVLCGQAIVRAIFLCSKKYRGSCLHEGSRPEASGKSINKVSDEELAQAGAEYVVNTNTDEKSTLPSPIESALVRTASPRFVRPSASPADPCWDEETAKYVVEP